MLVHLDLLVHIEIGQPVIHHDDGVDVIERISRFSGYAVPNLHRIAFSRTVCKYGKLVSGFQLRFLDELPDHIWWHVPIDGIDDADFVCLEVILSTFHHLRNAQQFRMLFGQLAGDMEAVARSGEIKDNAFVLFPSQDASESKPEEATAPLITAAPMRFKASRRVILLSSFIFIQDIDL